MLPKGTERSVKSKMRFSRSVRAMLGLAAIVAVSTPHISAVAGTTIFECSGLRRGYDRVANTKLPATPYTRLFAFNEDKNSIFEYINQQWTVLDPDAEVGPSDISARYSRDYADGRVDVIFELNRIDNSLVYILDVNERPGEFFNAHCYIATADKN
jgi:hypothetical protein